jgi:gluconate 2-dehydrogenase alpha chain
VRKQNFEARTNCEVTRINLEGSGKRATGVTFVDSSGAEWEQTADLVLLCAFQLFNVQLLLLSGIGQAYDPRSGRTQLHPPDGVDGGRLLRQGAIQFQSVHLLGLDRHVHRRVQRRQFHGPLGFVGGGYLDQVQTNGRPIESTLVPPGTPAWGSAWKRAVRDNYLSKVYSGAGVHASWYAYRNNYLDLDPTYKDRFGRPLLRMTMDFHENELKMNAYLTDKYAEIIERMGAKQVVKRPRTGPYDITAYQTSHLCGGAIMGTNPGSSALNIYLQSWDVPNLFVQGASAFPQNAGYNPTGTVAALAFWSAAAIRSQYLKNPGPLVHA